ncbi:hypothetical protein RBB78_15045 [Tunturiibacter empetritectus]|uniref:hypothetical protein n=1 Tax=Tunturiibacter empetritectus TaxID=3069691 RepID=UPI003D9B9068
MQDEAEVLAQTALDGVIEREVENPSVALPVTTLPLKESCVGWAPFWPEAVYRFCWAFATAELLVAVPGPLAGVCAA